MREYALMMNTINYAGVLNMNTVKHLRWSVLQKARVRGVELGPFNKGTS